MAEFIIQSLSKGYPSFPIPIGNSHNIRDLKRRVADEWRVIPSRIAMIYNGKFLLDDESLDVLGKST